MKRVSLLLLIAVVLVGGVYAVHAYADKTSDDAAAKAEKATVQKIDQNTDKSVQCPRHPDCPSDCKHTGNCTSDCPKFVDKDKDGQCDTNKKCHSAGKPAGCPGHSANMQKGCPGHANGGCGKH